MFMLPPLITSPARAPRGPGLARAAWGLLVCTAHIKSGKTNGSFLFLRFYARTLEQSERQMLPPPPHIPPPLPCLSLIYENIKRGNEWVDGSAGGTRADPPPWGQISGILQDSLELMMTLQRPQIKHPAGGGGWVCPFLKGCKSK